MCLRIIGERNLKQVLINVILSFAISVIGGLIVIPILKRIKAGQPILKYVDEHKQKNGTPTMGGLFFIIPSCIVYFLLNGFSNRIALVSIAVGLAFLCVGFIDDFIKIKFHKNEGLKAYQKIIFQFFISLFAGLFCYKNSITKLYLPFTKISFDIGIFVIVFVFFVFIATTNSVNLTDGLDGLAGSVSLVYLIDIIILLSLQTAFFYKTATSNQTDGLINLSSCIIGGILAFLIFNTNKASVFMGDTGSLSLGGFIASISVFSSNSLYVAVFGVMFLASSLTVIIQVVYFKATKGKRVFKMAPYHHHLQMNGLSESKIAYLYSLVTGIMGVLSFISYL